MECIDELQQPIASAGLAGTTEQLKKFLYSSSFTSDCKTSVDQGVACTVIQEGLIKVKSGTAQTTTTVAEQVAHSSYGLDPGRDTQSTSSGTIKDRVGQWLLTQIKDTILPSDRTRPSETWWREGKKLLQSYLTYVKGLEQPYP